MAQGGQVARDGGLWHHRRPCSLAAQAARIGPPPTPEHPRWT